MKNNFLKQSLRQTLAAVALTAIFAVPFTANAQSMSAKTQAAKTTATATATKKLTEDQKILHVLNRLGFGARPGDVERVKSIGLEKYIEQQLNADKISDSAAEAKIQNLSVLKLSTAELFAKYPNPAAVLGLVAQNNGVNAKQLKGDLKTDKKENKNEAENGAMAAKDVEQNPAAMSAEDRREYQRQIAKIYIEKGLGRPNEINQQLIASRILRAAYSERQLQETMVDFWTNHFNVFAGKAATRWFLPEYDRDVIRPNALGNFRDLLTATAKSSAMLFFLDNFQSVAANNNPNQGNNRMAKMLQNGKLNERQKERLRERGLTDDEIQKRVQRAQQAVQRMPRGINENYARELMELHTLGVDGGYTQKDIQEIARAFTGWTIADPRGYRKAAAKTGMGDEQQSRAMKKLSKLGGVPDDIESGEFYFNARTHDTGEKTIFGQKINAGGMKDGLQVIDILVKHPATAKFIARKLAIKFVNDNPSDALVNRIADAFSKSNGDIKATLRAVFTSPEFFAPENYRAKIKTPFEVQISAMRVLGADTNGGAVMQGLLSKMGEPLYGYQAPTGYPDTAEDWVNTGALLERLNFGLALAANRIPGTKIDLTKYVGKDPDDKEKVMNTFIAAVLQNEISPNTKATLTKQLNQPLPEPKLETEDDDGLAMENASMPREKLGGGKGRNGANAANRLLPPSGNAEAVKILGLILGSPEFQRQ